jgi:putative membrane protein
MLWIKAFHVIFMVTWFAGLFYLPRLFVYHTRVADEASLTRFETMERKLFGIMTLGATGTVICGLWLLFGWWWPLRAEWLEIKLGLVVLLIAYHIYLGVLCKRLRRRTNAHGETYFRWINEAPALLLIAIVILAMVKPF